MKKAQEKLQKGEPKKNDVELGSAWMLWLVLVALVGGLVFGCLAMTPIPTMKRPVFALICASIAFLLLTLQMLLGFPLENSIEKKMAEDRAKRAEKLAPKKGKPAGFEDGFQALGDMMMDVEFHFTFWFWLAYLATAVPQVVFAVDWYTRRQLLRFGTNASAFYQKT